MNPMNMFGGMNPLTFIQAMKKGGNPMDLMQSMFGNNPQYQRVMQMVKGKSPKEVRRIAMNLCEQRGLDFNDAVNKMKEMGLNIPEEGNTPENEK